MYQELISSGFSPIEDVAAIRAMSKELITAHGQILSRVKMRIRTNPFLLAGKIARLNLAHLDLRMPDRRRLRQLTQQPLGTKGIRYFSRMFLWNRFFFHNTEVEMFLDPRVCKVKEMLHAQVPNVPDGPAVTTGNAAEPVEKFSTEELALSVGLSEGRLRTLFKATTGLTPKQYLKKLEMERAREMAETTPLKIEEIMTILGFDDFSHFKRAFKREMGLTLTECRKRKREEDK